MVVTIISIDEAFYENFLLVKFLLALVIIKSGGLRYVLIHIICSVVYIAFAKIFLS
jgi:hypothetical protein